MKRPKIVSTLGASLLLIAATAQAQRTEEIATGLGLGVHRNHEIVVLSEDRFCMVSPEIAIPAGGLTHLVVVEHVVDEPLVHYLPLTFAAPLMNHVWHKPLALSPSAVAIPGPGLDRKYGTSDDELIVYSGLDRPTTATQQSYPLPLGAPMPEYPLYRITETEFAWLDPGPEMSWQTGNESFRIVRDIGPALTEITIPLPAGTDGYVFELAPDHHVARSAGIDGITGTLDDEYTSLRLDEDLQIGVMGMQRAPDEMQMPILGAQWPQAVGQSFAMPNVGRDGRLGTPDDEIRINTIGVAKSNDHRVVGPGFFNILFGPGRIAAESDGTVVMAGPGLDGSPGTSDDVVGFFSAQRTAQTFTPGVALASATMGQPHPDVLMLEGDVALVRHYGATAGSNIGAGVLAFHRSPNTGARVMVNHSFGEAVVKMLPMGRAACAFVLESGQVRMASRLDTPSPFIQDLGPQLHPADGKPVVLSPSMLASFTAGPTGLGYHDDRFRLWRARSAWEYGAPTANDQGYAMRLRADGSIPVVAGPSFFLTLEDAPPSQSGYCLISLERGSVLVAQDAELLVSLETIFTPYYWQTLPDGSTWFPIIPPTDPQFEGMRLHLQFIVFNNASARAYELSNGLTLQF